MKQKGQEDQIIENGFKFLWSGGCKAENGVGVIVANCLIGRVVGVQKFNDEGQHCYSDVIWEVVSCYCPDW